MIDLLASPIANALSLTLVHFLWQGLLVAFGYWALHEVAPVRSARIRYATALIALGVMAACPLMTFMTVHEPATTGVGAALTGSHASPAPAGTVMSLQNDPATDSLVVPRTPVDESTATSSGGTAAVESIVKSAGPYVVLLWMAGVVLSGARLMAGLANVVWLRKGRMEIDVELHQRSREIARRMGLTTARVFSSARIREAAVVGFWRPVVLLPTSWLLSLPSDVLEAVIAHEFAHIRRFDVWVNLFQRILETLLFYHPAVWWLSNRIRLEREMCCDELAVHATGELGAYAIALEQVGNLKTHSALQLAPTFTGDERMNLLNRVQHVLGVHRSPDREPTWLVGIVAVVTPLLIFGISGAPWVQNAAVAQERDGVRPAEAEAGPRRSAEGDGQRRSAEAEAGERRSAEAEAGPRRSAEGDGQRRSAEAEAGERRSAEAERGAGPSAEGENRRDGSGALGDFEPQTERETVLFQMIVQLQQQIAELRRDLQSQGGQDQARTEPRDGDAPRRDGESAGEDAEQFVLSPNWENTNDGRVFQAYDHNGDHVVSLDEWLAMTNGNISAARREVQTKRFNEAEPGGDGEFTPAEFIYWYSIGRHEAVERSRSDGDRDGDRRGPRDGESRGARDGERTFGPRDGE